MENRGISPELARIELLFDQFPRGISLLVQRWFLAMASFLRFHVEISECLRIWLNRLELPGTPEGL